MSQFSSHHLTTLVMRDIEYFRPYWFLYTLIGVVAIALMFVPSTMTGYGGSIVLVTAMAVFYSHLCFASLILEHKRKQDVFVLSMPISLSTYLFSKYLSAIVMFVGFWLLMSGFMFVFLWFTDHFPAVFMAWISEIFSLYLLAFFIASGVALLKRSEMGTLITIVTLNILLSIFCDSSPVFPDMAPAFALGTKAQAGIVWPASAIWVVIGSLFLTAITILVTVQGLARKKDFIS